MSKFKHAAKIPESVLAVAAHLLVRKHQAFLVGGAVRDLLLGREPKDWDLATDATPEEVKAVFEGQSFYTVYDLGKAAAHGTVGIHLREFKTNVEVTTFRKDLKCDGRHATVEYTDNILEDLGRRDLTFNAMAVNMHTFEFVDPFDGELDLRDGLINTVGDPRVRFKEDYLRMLRAVRFLGLSNNMSIGHGVAVAISELKENLRLISVERQTDELLKMLSYPKPSRALKAAIDLRLLDNILPELYGLEGMDQNRWHEVYECSRCKKKFTKILEDNFVGFYHKFLR